MSYKIWIKEAKQGFFLLMLLLLAACSGEKEDAGDTSGLSTVQLVLQLPKNATTEAAARVGDPGDAIDEDQEDWDCLALIFAYKDGGSVVKEFLTKADMEKLQNFTSDGSIKEYKIQLPEGEVYVYGVTFSSEAADNPKANIEACKTKEEVEALAISSDYAKSTASDGETQTAISKVLSVATGYYQGTTASTTGATSGSETGIPQTIKIPQEANALFANLPLMTLCRLASKIDVQWDTKNAFVSSDTSTPYAEMSVDGFTYYGGVGRLFPALYSYKAASTSDMTERYAYANTSAISQRNGRAYFYIFPDGITPSVTTTGDADGVEGKDLTSAYLQFHITSRKTAADEALTTTYNFKFKDKLQQATWYKVNTRISGNKSQETTVLVGK